MRRCGENNKSKGREEGEEEYDWIIHDMPQEEEEVERVHKYLSPHK